MQSIMSSKILLLLAHTLAYTLLLISPNGVESFQSFFKIPSFSLPNVSSPLSTLNESELLKAISNTSNGKDTTKTQQKQVLNLVQQFETQNPPDVDVLTNLEKGQKLVDGVWYLQYTSPSIIEDDGDGDEDDEEPKNKIEQEDSASSLSSSSQFQAQGSVSAGGITVDVSNKLSKQIFDLQKGTVFNEVELDYGLVRVGGTFKVAEDFPNRVIVCFQEGSITLKNPSGFKIDFSFLFALRNLLRSNEAKDQSWLETTYLSDDIRISRGNKGSMFVLTRDKDAVTP